MSLAAVADTAGMAVLSSSALLVATAAPSRMLVNRKLNHKLRVRSRQILWEDAEHAKRQKAAAEDTLDAKPSHVPGSNFRNSHDPLVHTGNNPRTLSVAHGKGPQNGMMAKIAGEAWKKHVHDREKFDPHAANSMKKSTRGPNIDSEHRSY